MGASAKWNNVEHTDLHLEVLHRYGQKALEAARPQMRENLQEQDLAERLPLE